MYYDFTDVIKVKALPSIITLLIEGLYFSDKIFYLETATPTN